MSDTTADVAEATPTAAREAAAAGPGWRTGLSIFLAVAVGILAPLTVLGAWVRAQVNSADAWVATVGPLADNPDVQAYLATELTDALFTAVPVEQFISENLPPVLAPAAPTITSALQGFVLTQAQRFTASDTFSELWKEANRRAHDRIKQVIAGDTGPLEVEGGAVTLDVGDMLRELQTRLVDRGLTIAGRFDLSNVDRQIVLLENDQLQKIDDIRKALDTLNTLVIVFFVLTVLAAVGAVVVANDRRRALMWLAGAVAVGAVVTIIAIQIARQAFLNALTNTVPNGVSGALFDAVANSLKMGFRFILAVGVVALILTFLTRLSSYARVLARPAQAVVVVLAVVALIVPDNYQALYVIAVLLLAVVTIVALEVARRKQLAAAPPAPVAPATPA
jgi:hypothetical protein